MEIRWSIERKIVSGIVVMAIFGVLIAVAGVHNIAIVREKAQDIVCVANEIRVVQNLRIAFQQLIMPPNDYLIHAHEEEFGHFDAALKKTKDMIVLSRKFLHEHAEIEALGRFEISLKKVEKLGKDILSIKTPIGSEEGGRLMEKMDKTANKAIGEIGEIIRAASVEIIEEEAKTREVKERATKTTIGFGVGMIFLSLAGGIAFARRIAVPLKHLSKAAQRISTGDLSAKARISSTDEIGDLAISFNRMVEDLEQTTTSIDNLNKEIAERKKAEEELAMKNMELEHFTHTVSHDLKSPLITIKGFAHMIAKDAESGKKERLPKDIASISRAVDKMGILIDELLKLSRIGRTINAPQNVEFGEIARDVVSLLEGRISQEDVTVTVLPDLPTLHVDGIRMHEVLQNLIENAIKYMGEQKEPQIEIGVRKDAEETVCYVKDNGEGIDSKNHEKIFELFNMLDKKREGAGAGLAIVKRIIEVHGGRIWVESEGKGKGSTFCFVVPIKSE